MVPRRSSAVSRHCWGLSPLAAMKDFSNGPSEHSRTARGGLSVLILPVLILSLLILSISILYSAESPVSHARHTLQLGSHTTLKVFSVKGTFRNSRPFLLFVDKPDEPFLTGSQ